MKRHTTIIAIIAVLIVSFFTDPVIVEAKGTCAVAGCGRTAISHSSYCSVHTCCKPDCYKLRNNGTVYCDAHAREWLRESGQTACSISGCYAPAKSGSSYCSKHECEERGCHSIKVDGTKYCSKHNPSNKSGSSRGSSTSGSRTTSRSSNSRSTSSRKYDPYNVYSYSSAQDFADDKYEEFYDYEDDYEDEDEAYDAAEDYWRAHH